VTTISLDRTAATKRKIESREARIGIVGMGYVGLPLALLFSEQRFAITGFDIDGFKVETLNHGGSYIVRIPGAEIQLAQKGGFVATADYSRIGEMDVVIICVPTPLNDFHEPNLPRNNGGSCRTDSGARQFLRSQRRTGCMDRRVLRSVLPRAGRPRQRHRRTARHSQGRGRLWAGRARPGVRTLCNHLQPDRSSLFCCHSRDDQAA